MSDLLPPSASPAERAISETCARLAAMPLPLRDLWDPLSCPAEALPWLAWALSVDVWDSAWSDTVKRRVCAESIAIHRRKGTVWAVREALRAAGYAEATITEGLPRLTHDGAQLYSGEETYFGGSRWAQFDVAANLGETEGISAENRERLLRLIVGAKPASRHLRAVSFSATMSDLLEQAEAIATAVAPELSEEAHFGLTYGGQILHDQAQLIEGATAVLFDGLWRYGAEQIHSGQNKYASWDVTGECYAGERSALALGAIPMTAADIWSVAAPDYDGLCVADGAARYGEPTTAPRDGMQLTLTRQVRHNARHNYNGLRHHAATNTEALTA